MKNFKNFQYKKYNLQTSLRFIYIYKKIRFISRENNPPLDNEKRNFHVSKMRKCRWLENYDKLENVQPYQSNSKTLRRFSV